MVRKVKLSDINHQLTGKRRHLLCLQREREFEEGRAVYPVIEGTVRTSISGALPLLLLFVVFLFLTSIIRSVAMHAKRKVWVRESFHLCMNSNPSAGGGGGGGREGCLQSRRMKIWDVGRCEATGVTRTKGSERGRGVDSVRFSDPGFLRSAPLCLFQSDQKFDLVQFNHENKQKKEKYCQANVQIKEEVFYFENLGPILGFKGIFKQTFVFITLFKICEVKCFFTLTGSFNNRHDLKDLTWMIFLCLHRH